MEDSKLQGLFMIKSVVIQVILINTLRKILPLNLKTIDITYFAKERVIFIMKKEKGDHR